MYNFITLGGEPVEVCDECGFDGGQVKIAEVSTRFDDVRRAWATVFAGDEALLRARPAPATWCTVEYAEHTAFALAAIEWAAREFVQLRSPDWTQLPSDRLGDASDDNHDCESIAIDDVLDQISRASLSLAAFTESLSDADLFQVQDYGGGMLLTTGAVIRHALHDAEHHVLDIRRGMARLLLNA